MIPLFKVLMASDTSEKVSEVLNSGYIGQGSMVDLFEDDLQSCLGSKVKPLTVNSATSALDLAFHLCGVGPGDEVIAPPMSCIASFVGIVHRGASIVWADIDPRTGLISPEDVGRKITNKTKAILGVDWGGAPCDYEALRSFGLPVIEDAAHAFLAQYKGESIARSGGDFVCWSFQAIKTLTCGDGGALLVPENLYERTKCLRWYGLDRSKGSPRYFQFVEEAGFKYHMNDISATIGRTNLPAAKQAIKKQRENAAYYYKSLQPSLSAILPPDNPYSSWWLYTLCVPDRDRFVAKMEEQEVMVSMVHSRCDLHPCFSQFLTPLPGVDIFAHTEVAIPCGWWVDETDRDKIVEAAIKAME